MTELFLDKPKLEGNNFENKIKAAKHYRYVKKVTPKCLRIDVEKYIKALCDYLTVLKKK